MTKIVFMGTPAFSVPILDGLVEAGYEVLAVVTQPDRPVGRKKVLTAPPVKEAAVTHGLPVYQPEKIGGSQELDEIIALGADVIVTAAFGQFLPEKLIQAPKFGAVNVHASLLPKYRGGAPVHYSIMKGDNETGVTIMEMVKKMDAGDILSQGAIPILPTDDVGSMFDKLSLLGRDLLLETLPRLFKGEITPVEQDESRVTYSPNITREEEKIDFNKTADEIDWQVRGMRPWPVAYTIYHDTRWKLWDVSVVHGEVTSEAPGVIIKKDKHSLWISCGAGTIISVNRIQPAGKGQLSIVEFVNSVGQNVKVGNRLG